VAPTLRAIEGLGNPADRLAGAHEVEEEDAKGAAAAVGKREPALCRDGEGLAEDGARLLRTEAVYRAGDGADGRGHGLAEHGGDATGQGPHGGGTETYARDGRARASASSCDEAPAGITSASASLATPAAGGLSRSMPAVAIIMSCSTACSLHGSICQLPSL